MDVNNSDFQSMIKSQQQARVKQTKEILNLLAKKEGIRIKFDDIKKLVAPNGSIGRPHIARAITSAGGTTNVMDAYAKYIQENNIRPDQVTEEMCAQFRLSEQRSS